MNKTPIADSIMDWILAPAEIKEPKKTRCFQLTKEELKEHKKSLELKHECENS